LNEARREGIDERLFRMGLHIGFGAHECVDKKFHGIPLWVARTGFTARATLCNATVEQHLKKEKE
jgi:hypothetical protein